MGNLNEHILSPIKNLVDSVSFRDLKSQKLTESTNFTYWDM